MALLSTSAVLLALTLLGGVRAACTGKALQTCQNSMNLCRYDNATQCLKDVLADDSCKDQTRFVAMMMMKVVKTEQKWCPGLADGACYWNILFKDRCFSYHIDYAYFNRHDAATSADIRARCDEFKANKAQIESCVQSVEDGCKEEYVLKAADVVRNFVKTASDVCGDLI